MAKCKDCIYVDICDYTSGTTDTSCGHFKDSSKFVELPCDTGEKVWVTYSGKEEKGEVIGFYITASLHVYTNVILEDGNTFTGVYGKNVFPRKEKFGKCKSYG